MPSTAGIGLDPLAEPEPGVLNFELLPTFKNQGIL